MSNPKKARQTGFLKVGECLYRHETSGTYYALVKSNGKQIRRPLKTKDLPLAKPRLREFREKIGRLDLTDGKPKLIFPELAEKWRATLAPHLKPSSALHRDSSIVQLNRCSSPVPSPAPCAKTGRRHVPRRSPPPPSTTNATP